MKLTSERLIIRPLQEEDTDSLLRLIKNNIDFWAETEPKREESYYTVEVQRQNIISNLKSIDKGTGNSFGIFTIDGRLIGDISLYEVRKLPFQSAYVGFSLDKGEVGKGYATEALRLILAYAFEKLDLHRVVAGVMPRNLPSIGVLEKVGFQREGLCRENVCINGVWEDHLQYSMLNADWRTQQLFGL